jgi:hypothetical protein
MIRKRKKERRNIKKIVEEGLIGAINRIQNPVKMEMTKIKIIAINQKKIKKLFQAVILQKMMKIIQKVCFHLQVLYFQYKDFQIKLNFKIRKKIQKSL